MKLMPAARAAWIMRIDSAWSGLPQAPNIIAPRHSLLTETPVCPSGRCSMGAPYLCRVSASSRAVDGSGTPDAGRGVGMVSGVGVRADAQPYLGPRSGVAPERRHDG